ncbi:MAG: Pectate lyase [Hydrocarboniphaga sp.]|uniref:hypothetical protein n=1 Tax=Hydrocarboniphaga sp. TaxID=2033016 RepID=UPI00262FE2A9|nr:hypothetical protein [Hydrocarboniphaga sp.]MDB5972514.1 Pectate lyase [Hydrocarboniphaga sp.]
MKAWAHLVCIGFLGSAQIAHAAKRTGPEPYTAIAPAPQGTQKSFPGAEGYGAYAKGGRGGAVLFVTNLDDSGSGSFRAAATSAGPRTIVFRVSGYIALESPIEIKSPFLTIAGQTAPGGGVCIRGDKVVVNTHDVIIRQFCSRIGKSGGATVPSKRRSLDIRDAQNVIVDHSSFSWSLDDVVGVIDLKDPLDTKNITIQWSILTEPLFQGAHPLGGPLVVGGGGGGVTNISLHHNLFSQCHVKCPSILSGETVDFVNNYTFNWASLATAVTSGSSVGNHKFYGPSFVNIVNNLYKAGPGINSPSPLDGRIVVGQKRAKTAAAIRDFRVYVHGNVDDSGRPADTVTDGEGLLRIMPAEERAQVLARSPVNNKTFELSVENTQGLGEKILRSVGRTIPKRDAVDMRVVDDVRQGRGRKSTVPEDAGGYPNLASGTAYPDADQDGMDDAWETAHHLSPKNPSDRNLEDRNGDGYTNLEEFLNYLATQRS